MFHFLDTRACLEILSAYHELKLNATEKMAVYANTVTAEQGWQNSL